MIKPFQPVPFDTLPDAPRVPHPWWRQPAQRVRVDSPRLGSTEVVYRAWGDGPPLVLVHGLMTSGYSWRYVVEPLAERWRVIVPDLPGAGETRCEARLSASALADWMGRFLSAVDARGAPVVGNSMGGYLGMHLALQDPAAIGRLLVLHAPGVPTPRMRALHLAMRLPGATALLGALVARDPERWAHRHVHYRDESLKSREEARVYGAPLSTTEGRRAFASWLRDGLDAATLARFARALRRRHRAGEPFPVPLRLVYATTDPMVPPVVGERLHRWLPGADLIWLDDSSHFAQVDTPRAFLAASVGWLAGDEA